MIRVKRLSRHTLELVVLVALFPFWGIGAVQVFSHSMTDVAQSGDLPLESILQGIAAVIFSATVMLSGLVLSLRGIIRRQAEKIPRLDAVQRYCVDQIDPDGIYDFDQEYDTLPRLHARALDNLSYTRVWYLSFQNHLLAKSGIDTVKLTPLKSWPSILKNEMSEDLVPVWNLPLLLISLGVIPAIALLIAALDVVFQAITGASFCSACYACVNAISSAFGSLVLNFPVPFFLLAFSIVALVVVPWGTRRFLLIKGALQDAEEKRSELLLSSLTEDEMIPGSFAQTRNLAIEP